MRKKESIHVHALLAEVTRQLIEDEAMSVEGRAAYDLLGTRPSSIHESKENHRKAIMVLCNAIESSLEETHTDGQKQSAHR
ncbi:UPF0058 family protein [Haloarcula sp. GH36]|uniref:UPF0058 family protein n=1 Tax=Haloarcula montana TaxID=3111776 RepID=UPI002D79A4E9|nr:UPF0058 family protein [Haloarcula sp. GH36]